MAIIAPSILNADFSKLDKEIQMLNESDAEWIHLDVMDARNAEDGIDSFAQQRVDKRACAGGVLHLLLFTGVHEKQWAGRCRADGSPQGRQRSRNQAKQAACTTAQPPSATR